MSPVNAAELAPLYAEETGLSERVCLALLKGDVTPPPRWKVDAQGWDEAQRRAIKAHYDFTALPTDNDD